MGALTTNTALQMSLRHCFLSFKIATKIPVPTSYIYGSPNPVIMPLHLSDSYHVLSPSRASNEFVLRPHLGICTMNSSEVICYKELVHN